ncbi:uncharacterized protein LOC131666415 [Phymastichus coffea]|uniref:uncharacterized protein LOC131666415 n=1 Tax=Phymastichus coffea TaxID=108790 RepID=UPI00273BEF63|nr:uncharacterized protein LOC131666415 [Phymastichus coffea]
MMKFTCLIFLVAVAISWSYIDAKPSKLWARSALTMAKRQTDSLEPPSEYDVPKSQAESDETPKRSEESETELAKELIAGLLLLTVDSDNSAEVDRLTLAFKKAAKQKWDSLYEYASHLFRVYEEVTGRKPDDSNEAE